MLHPHERRVVASKAIPSEDTGAPVNLAAMRVDLQCDNPADGTGWRYSYIAVPAGMIMNVNLVAIRSRDVHVSTVLSFTTHDLLAQMQQVADGVFTHT